MRRFRFTQNGFTLLEVLVALAVLAIALASLLKGIFNNAANEAYLRDKTLAQWVAMNVVAEQQLAEKWPTKGKKRGSETMGGHEWFWRYEIKETFDEDVRRLEVKVRASDDSDVSPLSSVVAFLPKPVN
jgi:general secretion pathway protein I